MVIFIFILLIIILNIFLISFEKALQIDSNYIQCLEWQRKCIRMIKENMKKQLNEW